MKQVGGFTPVSTLRLQGTRVTVKGQKSRRLVSSPGHPTSLACVDRLIAFQCEDEEARAPQPASLRYP